MIFDMKSWMRLVVGVGLVGSLVGCEAFENAYRSNRGVGAVTSDMAKQRKGKGPMAKASSGPRVERGTAPDGPLAQPLPAKPGRFGPEVDRVWTGAVLAQGIAWNKMRYTLPHAARLDLRGVQPDGRFHPADLRVVTWEDYENQGDAAFERVQPRVLKARYDRDKSVVFFERGPLNAHLPLEPGQVKTINWPVDHLFVVGDVDRLAKVGGYTRGSFSTGVFAPTDDAGEVMSLYDERGLVLKSKGAGQTTQGNNRPILDAAGDAYRRWIALSMTQLRLPHDLGVYQVDNRSPVIGLDQIHQWVHSAEGYLQPGTLAQWEAQAYYAYDDAWTVHRYRQGTIQGIADTRVTGSALSLAYNVDFETTGWSYDIPDFDRLPDAELQWGQAQMDKAIDELIVADMPVLNRRLAAAGSLAKQGKALTGWEQSRALWAEVDKAWQPVMDRPALADWRLRWRSQHRALFDAAVPDMVAVINRTKIPDLDRQRREWFSDYLAQELGGDTEKRVAAAIAARRERYKQLLATAPKCDVCGGLGRVEAERPSDCRLCIAGCASCGYDGVTDFMETYMTDCLPCRATGKTIPPGY